MDTGASEVQCKLQCVVDEPKLQPLLRRLQSLCDGAPLAGIPLNYTESVYVQALDPHKLRRFVYRQYQEDKPRSQFLFYGPASMDEKRKTLTRETYSFPGTTSLPEIMALLGLTLEQSYDYQGTAFSYRGSFLICVGQKSTAAYQTMVEVTTNTRVGQLEATEDAMLNISEQLKPIIELQRPALT